MEGQEEEEKKVSRSKEKRGGEKKERASLDWNRSDRQDY
jgi:hypothetical protein